MMKGNISKSLKRIAASTAAELRTKEVSVAYKDYIVAAILDDDATMAYTLLGTLMQEWQIKSLVAAIRRECATASISEVVSPESYYDALFRLLGYGIEARNISTVHLLYSAVVDSTSATSRILNRYGINDEDILSALARLTHEGPTRGCSSTKTTETINAPTRDISIELTTSNARLNIEGIVAVGERVSVRLGDSNVELSA